MCPLSVSVSSFLRNVCMYVCVCVSVRFFLSLTVRQQMKSIYFTHISSKEFPRGRKAEKTRRHLPPSLSLSLGGDSLASVWGLGLVVEVGVVCCIVCGAHSC